MHTSRIIGIDYGRKRIGIACSDPLRLTAQPLITITLKSLAEAVNRVCEMLREHDVELVVVGLPVSLAGGTAGQMATEIKAFAAALQKRGYSVAFWDESFTSRDAMSAMRQGGKREKQMRGKTDVIAAQLILQAYLDEHPELK